MDHFRDRKAANLRPDLLDERLMHDRRSSSHTCSMTASDMGMTPQNAGVSGGAEQSNLVRIWKLCLWEEAEQSDAGLYVHNYLLNLLTVATRCLIRQCHKCVDGLALDLQVASPTDECHVLTQSLIIARLMAQDTRGADAACAPCGQSCSAQRSKGLKQPHIQTALCNFVKQQGAQTTLEFPYT